MKTRRRLLLLAILALVVIGLGLLLAGVSADPSGTVSGVVVDADGPVEGATVRIQATTNATTSAADGAFTLGGLTEGITVTVSAWKHTYYCAKVEGVVPPANDITLTLRHYQTDDNPDYDWELPITDDPEHTSCAHCKLGVTEIWLENAHAGAGTNPRFLSMYNGTDADGNPGVPPGFVQDFPGTTGNCATCHAPGAAIDAPFTTDMNTLTGANTFGVHCDFCHKVADLYLNPATGLPYENAPGVLSMDVRRPYPESERFQLFFGTFDDDNVPEEDTYLPLIETSQFCAPCHQFSMWGTPIYQSFKEWLESPYPQMGVECQICHMPPDGVMTNVAPGFGGVERDPMTIHAHTQPGAADVELLQNTVSMTISARQVVDSLRVSVTITNTGAGHHVPTDHPARNMILLVRATDDQERELAQVAGPTVPYWGGVGPDPDDYAGWPGKGYAKVLRDVVSGEAPVASYWKQALIQSDNRLAAFEADTTTYDFPVPEGGGNVEVEAKLIFRRAFKSLAEAKGWEMEDIVMETEVVAISLRSTRKVYLPAVMRKTE